MGRLIDFPGNDPAREAAYAWLVCLDEGLSESEREGLEAWLAESPEHPRILVDAAKCWDDSEVLRELSEVFPLDEWKSKRSRPPHRRLAAAGAVLGVLTVIAWLFYVGIGSPGSPDSGLDSARASRDYGNGGSTIDGDRVDLTDVARYETAVGQQQSVRLPDGSLVTMNTDTLVRVRYLPDSRSVILERGEASFDVATDTARPFRVTAGSRVFEALGTVFNIELVSNDSIELTVTEGKVRVSQDESKSGARRPPRITTGGSSRPADLTVTAGELAVIYGATERISQPAAPVVQANLAWQRGMLVFQGEPLAEALAEMGRYTSTRFQFADESIGRIRVGGYFRAGDTDALLLALRSSFAVEARELGEDLFVLERPAAEPDPGE